MAISTNVTKVTYQGDGDTTAFPFSTIFPNDVVYVQDIDVQNYIKCKIIANGTETVLTSDYFVDVQNRTLYYPGYAPGSEPVDQPAKLTAGEYIVIYRAIPVTQESDLGSKWPFATIEAGLDKLTMIVQDSDAVIAKSISDISASGTTLTYTKHDGTTGTVTTQDTTYTIITGTTPGTISVNGTDVAVGGLATVATTGDYDDLTDKPTIPTAVSQLTNDAGYITSVDWDDVGDKPTFATVATTGDYDDLTNKPSFATVATTGDYDDLTDKPSFATVATTGDYDDLTNKPTIPVVPTNISAFNNDAGYLTGVDWSDVADKPSFATVATTGDYDDLTDKPTIPVVPTNISAFNNDAGYITGVAWDDVTSKPASFTPSAHNQASNTINAMTGYSKPGATSAISTSDTLNQAIGKLEKAIDDVSSVTVETLTTAEVTTIFNTAVGVNNADLMGY